MECVQCHFVDEEGQKNTMGRNDSLDYWIYVDTDDILLYLDGSNRLQTSHKSSANRKENWDSLADQIHKYLTI